MEGPLRFWLLLFQQLLALLPVPSWQLTSQRKGFSPECCSECTLSDMLRLKDFPQVSHVKGMSLVWAVG